MLSVSGTTALETYDLAGQYGNAGSQSTTSTDLTIEFRTVIRSNASAQYLTHIPSATGGSFGLAVRTTGNGAGNDLHLSWTVDGGSSAFFNWVTDSGSPIALNTLLHIVIVIPAGCFGTPSLVKLYINGVLTNFTGTASGSQFNGLATTLELFNRAAGARQFDGVFGYCRLWARACSAGEAAELFAVRTAADLAALSFASSLKVQVTGETNANATEYSAFPTGSTVTPTLSTSGGGAVTAADLSGLPEEFRPTCIGAYIIGGAGKAFTDSGGSTPLASNGDLIYRVNDQTLIGGTAIQATSGNRPTYFTDGGKHYAVHNNLSVDTWLAWANTTGPVFNARRCTIVMVGRFRKCGIEGRTAFSSSGSAVMLQQETSGKLSASNQVADITGCDSLSVFAAVHGASGTKIWRDLDVVAATTASAASERGGVIGANGSLGEKFDGTWSHVFILEEEASDTHMTAAITTLMSGAGITAKTSTVILQGSSSMQGTAASYLQNLTYRMQASLPTTRFINVAVGGQVVSAMVTNESLVQTIFDCETDLGITPALVAWAGSNDVYITHTAGATVAADIGALLDDYLAMGITQIAAVTVVQRSDTAYNAQRLALNAALPGLGYDVIDPTVEATIAAGGSSLAGAYDSGDGIHGNDAYFAAITPYFVTGITAMFTTGTPVTLLTNVLSWAKADRSITLAGSSAADQGTLDKAADLSGAANHLTCASGVELTYCKPPSVRAPLLRAKWDYNADFNLAPNRHIDIGTFAASAKINPNNYLLGMVIRMPWWRKNGGQPIFWFDGGSNDFGLGYGYDSQLYSLTHFGSASGHVPDVIPSMGKSVVVIRGTATETTVWWNDQVGVLTGNRGAGNSSGFHLGEIPTGANQPFDLFEFVLCNDQNTEELANDLRTYLAQANNRSLTTSARVTGLGDSLLYGQNTTGSANWLTLMDDLLPYDVELRLEAYPGDGFAEATTRFNSYVADTFLPGKLNVILLNTGTNDIYAGACTLAQYKSRIQAIVSLMKGRGFKVVVCTVVARQPASTAEDAVRLAANDWLRANWQGFADGLADRAANIAVANDVADAANIYIDSGDASKTHFNNLGNAAMATIDAPPINRLLARAAFTDLGGTIVASPVGRKSPNDATRL